MTETFNHTPSGMGAELGMVTVKVCEGTLTE